MIYILLTCFVIYLVSLCTSGTFDKSVHNKIVAIFGFFAIFFLYLFKDDSLLPDLNHYYTLFLDSLQISFSEIDELQNYRWYYKFEFFWCLLTKTVSSIFPYKESIAIVTYIVVLAGYLSFMLKFSKKVTFSVMLFLVMFFYNSCFVLRQNMAVAICLFSIPFVLKRKFVFFIAIVGLATLFHNSALFFVPIYFLYSIKITKKYMLLFGFVCAFFAAISYKLFSLFSWLSSYKSYIAGLENGVQGTGMNMTPFLITLSVLIFVICLIDLKKLEGIDLFCMHALLLACGLNFFQLGMPGVFSRLVLYYSASFCVFLPNVCEKINDKYLKIVSSFVIFLLYTLLCYRSMNYGFSLTFF